MADLRPSGLTSRVGSLGDAPATADAARFDGRSGAELASLLGLPHVEVRESVTSTMDVAHGLATEGAAGGTLVLADAQTSGRGRGGHQWISAPGQGLWLTMVERPTDPRTLDVLSLRLGLACANALDADAGETIALKWPNDLHVRAGKLGGVLVESRWRDARIEWVAIGIGINVRPAAMDGAGHLRTGAGRVDVLRRLIPALRDASARVGPLDDDELAAYARRDLARGRRCTAPAIGTVLGIAADGALRIRGGDTVSTHRDGSLLLEESA